MDRFKELRVVHQLQPHNDLETVQSTFDKVNDRVRGDQIAQEKACFPIMFTSVADAFRKARANYANKPKIDPKTTCSLLPMAGSPSKG